MAEARGRDISSLYGFEAAVNLTRLDMSNNDISHVPELAAFTQLETLVLSDNRISDVSPLASLTTLETLNLSMNYIDVAIEDNEPHILAIQARGTEVQV